METEKWLEVKNYCNYEVSNFGNFRKKGSLNNLKKTISGNKYICVSMIKDGKKKVFRLHQIVAMSFLNHIPNGNKLVINHIDGNGFNNNVDNLEIVSQRVNNSLRYRKDRYKFSSQYPGVSFHKNTNKWRSQYQLNGKKITIGIYKTEIEAHKAYINIIDEALRAETRVKPRM